jgi:aspartate/methionine/tyrosine aminotransferase
MNFTSKRVNDIQAPPLVELGMVAKETTGCISMGQGAPYYYPALEQFQSLIAQLRESEPHRYTPDPGIFTLREGLADKLSIENQIKCEAKQIIITPGANQAFFNVLLTVTDPNDEVILLSPYYFNHLMACESVNVIPKVIPLNTDFSLPLEDIGNIITPRTRAIVLVNPGNPTGMVHVSDDLKQLAEIAEKHGILIISDETYEYFTYLGRTHVSIAKFPDIEEQVVTIGSFSKTYGIPGWRLGYYHANDEIIGQSIKVQDTIGICAPAPSQKLGLELLQKRKSIIPPFVKLMESNFKLARDLIEDVPWLHSTPSGGAYYLFPQQTTALNSHTLSRRLISEEKVYIVPGEGFGSQWANHMRISFANIRTEELKEAFARLRSFRP